MRPTADFHQEYDRRKKKRKQLVFAWLKKKKKNEVGTRTSPMPSKSEMLR